MKRTVFAVSMGMLCLVGAVQGQPFNNDYSFNSTHIQNYLASTTSQVIEKVSSQENITVGFAAEVNNPNSSDIVVVKTNATTGMVIWSRRYGNPNIDERAYGVDLTYDEKSVIVVGTTENPLLGGDYDALAMKINLQSGIVSWSARYGEVGTREEWRTIEKSYKNVVHRSPTYFLAGMSVTDGQLGWSVYGGSIYDNGTVHFLKNYEDASVDDLSSDRVSSMVQNNANNFILAGHHSGGTSFESQIFTLGINPFTGAVSDAYAIYDAGEGFHFEPSIAKVQMGKQEGYALSFTSASPGISPSVYSGVGIMVLNSSRNPQWLNFYWEPENELNKGHTIFQNQANGHLLDVFIGTQDIVPNIGFHKPGFLQININTGSSFFYTQYNSLQVTDVEPASMIQVSNGYVAKSIIDNGFGGFKLTRMANNGQTDCIDYRSISRVTRTPQVASRTYVPVNHGIFLYRQMARTTLPGNMEPCDGGAEYAFRLPTEASEELTIEKEEAFSVFPNPVAQDGSALTLKYNLLLDKSVEIAIFNAIGQQTALQKAVLNAGENTLELESGMLSPGLNLISVRSEGEVLFQDRVIMK